MPHRHSLGRTLDLNLCFTKIKFPLHYFSQSSAAATTPPHDHSRPSPSAAAASSNADNLMIIRNFNSLYDSSSSSSSSSPSDHNTDSGAAAAAAGAACRSLSSGRRFFVSAPGRSNSIADSASASASASAAGRRGGGAAAELVGNSLAVPTLSPDPYADFRRSMQEMVEARERRLHRNDDDDDNDVKDNCSKNRSSNWEFLHELLLCYLALNPKSTHKFIIGAFSDLVVSMLPPLPPEINGGHKEVDLVAAAVAASDK